MLPWTHHSDEPAHKSEVHEMLRVNEWAGVDLQTVVLDVGVLKEAVHGIEHFVRYVKEPVPTQNKNQKNKKKKNKKNN